MAILTKFIFCMFMERDVIEVHKNKRGKYPAILTKKAWSIKDLLSGFPGNFSRRTQWIVPCEQDSSISPTQVANQFGSSYPLMELAI